MRGVIILCLVATFFVANVLAAPPSNCQPNKSYNVDCNTCVCGADGKLACTLKLCLKKRSASPDVNSCTPNEEKTIANGCNHCVCSHLGKWGCTETNLDRCRETPHITNFFRRKREELGKTCTPGEIKTTGNGCNYCRCLPGGQWACIDGNLEQCLKQEKANANRQKRERECQYGENKQDNCNTCFCVRGGNWACTRRACLSTEEVRSHGPPTEQGSFGPPQDHFSHGPPPETCTEGNYKTEGCVTCRCTDYSWQCFRNIDCRENNYPAPETCEEGQMKFEKCSTCFCVRGGTWACSRSLCPDYRDDVIHVNRLNYDNN